MNKGLLLEVLNTTPINATTRKIELRIKGESDFQPAEEVDVKTLTFGSYREVNFGRGARAVKSRVEGNDLIVTFNAKGCGIDADEWAPKLIGRDKAGKLLWGYARLPYVNYQPAMLSACAPWERDGKQYIEVENFGLTVSEACQMTVKDTNGVEHVIDVPALQPYEVKRFEL